MPEPVEREHAELPREIFARQRRVELPRVALGDERVVARRRQRTARSPRGTRISRGASRAEQRDRLVGTPSQSSRSSPVETSAAATPTRSAIARRAGTRADRADEVVARAVEQVVGERDAGRDRLDHLAAHDALRELRILHLLADRDAEALLHEPAHVVARRLHRDAGERHVRGAAVVARRQREAEHARRRLGVVIKHLVELAHAEKQDRVLMPALDLAVLLHERRLRRPSLICRLLPMSVTNASIFVP